MAVPRRASRQNRIAVGADADITVFDPGTIIDIDRTTDEAPTTPSADIPISSSTESG